MIIRHSTAAGEMLPFDANMVRWTYRQLRREFCDAATAHMAIVTMLNVGHMQGFRKGYAAGLNLEATPA